MALESASSGAVALLASQLITTSFKQRTDTSSHHLGAATATSAAAATSPDLRCLDGLRAICSALVVAFHTLLVWRAGVPFETYAPLARGHWFVQAALTGGPIAVDLFLVITGLLAAYQLVPQLECSSRGGWRVACGYWRRRALRLLPAYLAVLALAPRGGPADGVPPEAALAHTMFFSQCPAGLWRNLLLVSNWNFLGACGERTHSRRGVGRWRLGAATPDCDQPVRLCPDWLLQACTSGPSRSKPSFTPPSRCSCWRCAPAPPASVPAVPAPWPACLPAAPPGACTAPGACHCSCPMATCLPRLAGLPTCLS